MSGYIEEIDRNGLTYLPPRLRRDLGKKFFVLRRGNQLAFVPLPDDPTKDLAELGKSLPRRSLKQFRAEILKEAEEDLRGRRFLPRTAQAIGLFERKSETDSEKVRQKHYHSEITFIELMPPAKRYHRQDILEKIYYQ